MWRSWIQHRQRLSAVNAAKAVLPTHRRQLTSTTTSRSTKHIPICWLDLRGSGLSALERLLLEECLLQTDTERSWLIAGFHEPFHNRYLRLPPPPSPATDAMEVEDPNQSAAIVMGIGGKPHELLHVDQVQKDGVLTIKRFSGGGTVVMDHNAIWTTLIGRPHHFTTEVVQAFPRPLMKFTADSLFAPLFEKLHEYQQQQQSNHTAHENRNYNNGNDDDEDRQKTLVMDTKSCTATDNPGRVKTIARRQSTAVTPPPVVVSHNNDTTTRTPRFALRENDYVLGERKMGGNAQCITGKGWLHHTSFLWDFDPDNMLDYLTLPKKRPEYRQDRNHDDFLVTLQQVHPQLTKVDFCAALRDVCHEQFGAVQEVNWMQAHEILRECSGGGLQEWWETKSRTKIVQDFAKTKK